MHYMIDIETLSTAPEAHVIAIAIVRFDKDQVLESLMLYPDATEQAQKGRKIDYDTMIFWMNQGPLFHQILANHQKSLYFCLNQIRWFINLNAKDENIVWSKSPSFDLSILKSLFGSAFLPWKYSNEQDVRTACHKLISKNIPIIKPTVYHDPMSDALSQVSNVQSFLNL